MIVFSRIFLYWFLNYKHNSVFLKSLEIFFDLATVSSHIIPHSLAGAEAGPRELGTQRGVSLLYVRGGGERTLVVG